jgi:DNA-binding transcriptional ArsR family regulator
VKMANKEETDSQSDQSDQETVDLESQIYGEHQAIPEHLRQEVLERDGHRCQIKGCRGRAHNGSAQLLVQRIDQERTSGADTELTELETRCLRCSVWVAQMPTTDDLRPRIRQRLNGVTLEPNRAEILQYLAEKGPATTGEILENVNLGSKPGVRQALYALMGLDVRETDVNQRIVVKNRDDQTYGLPWQVPDEHDARGYIPVRPTELRNRILDELVCRLYRHLEGKIENPQEVIAAIVERKPRQIQHMRRRGEAFQFPFGQWVDQEQSREDPSAIIAAVDALADESNNLSRQLLSRNIASVYESNDEQLLADMLRAWAKSEDISPYLSQQKTPAGATDQESVDERSMEADNRDGKDDSSVAIHETSDEDAPQWELQVLDEHEANTPGSDLANFGPDQTDQDQNGGVCDE